MKRFIIYFLAVVCSSFVSAWGRTDQEMVVAQMNACVTTLTNIINNKSMQVLDHESDQLINNMTMQDIVGLPEIADFRMELIDGIGKLNITEQEKNLISRLNSIRQENLKWRAFSNALSNTMMITGGGNINAQAAFMALLTAARAGIEYKAASNEQQIEELQAMWELRKEDLKTFVELRKQALSIVFSLYQKYNLNESDRLTEQTSLQFQQIVTDNDPSKMVRLLLDNKSKFGHMADFYYYLGMGYLDTHRVAEALDAFKMYDRVYEKAPIYRVNEKGGIISLARLTHIQGLTTQQIETEIESVRKNLPQNTIALIQCAAVYANVLKNPVAALNLLRSALDAPNTPDKEAIVIAGSLVLPDVSKESNAYKAFVSAYNNLTTIVFDAALNMCKAMNVNMFTFIKSIVTIDDLYHRPWLIGSPTLNDKIKFIISNKYGVDISNIKMFVESKNKNEISVYEYGLQDASAVTLKEIEKVKAFKHNPKLKYLYLNSIGKNLYKVKENIDYNKILDDTYPHQSDFILSEDDLKDIVKFLKKHQPSENVIVANKIKNERKSISIEATTLSYPAGYNYKLLYNQFQHQKNSTYIKFVFDDCRKIIVCYKFDKDKKELIPCYTQANGKILFTNNSFKTEFGYNGVVKSSDNQTKETSKRPWWKFWASDDDSNDKVEKKVSDNSGKPWWKFWASDDPEDKTEKKAEKKVSDDSGKPWWKFWASEDDSEDKAAKKASDDSGKPWWKFWASDDPEDKTEKKTEKKVSDDSGKPWWKFWASEDPEDKADKKTL